MKKLIAAVVSGLFLASAGFAQQAPAPQDQKNPQQQQQQAMPKNCPMAGGMGMTGMRMGKMHRGMMAMGGCPNLARLMMMQQALNLSADQVSKIRNIQYNLIRTNAKNKAEIMITKMDLAEQMNMPSPNLNQVKVLMKKIADLKLQSQINKVDALSNGLSVLTNDQRAKLGQMRSAMMGGGMSGGMSGGADEDEDEDDNE